MSTYTLLWMLAAFCGLLILSVVATLIRSTRDEEDDEDARDDDN